MTAIDASSEQRAALARELQWLAGILPLGNGSEIFDGVADDRVAAIVATALLGLPSQAADEAITRALAAVGLQRGVDRAFYYELNETTASLTLAHEWHAPTVRPMNMSWPMPALVSLPPSVSATALVPLPAFEIERPWSVRTLPAPLVAGAVGELPPTVHV